eukprot:scaffold16944_cov18-Tisochrysis_lutea.AAC.1
MQTRQGMHELLSAAKAGIILLQDSNNTLAITRCPGSWSPEPPGYTSCARGDMQVHRKMCTQGYMQTRRHAR